MKKIGTFGIEFYAKGADFYAKAAELSMPKLPTYLAFYAKGSDRHDLSNSSLTPIQPSLPLPMTLEHSHDSFPLLTLPSVKNRSVGHLA